MPVDADEPNLENSKSSQASNPAMQRWLREDRSDGPWTMYSRYSR